MVKNLDELFAEYQQIDDGLYPRRFYDIPASLAGELTVDRLMEMGAEYCYCEYELYTRGAKYVLPPTKDGWLSTIPTIIRNGHAKHFAASMLMDDDQLAIYCSGVLLCFPAVRCLDTKQWIIPEPSLDGWLGVIFSEQPVGFLSEPVVDKNALLIHADEPPTQDSGAKPSKIMFRFRECGFPRLWFYSRERKLLLVGRSAIWLELALRAGYGDWLSEKLKHRERVRTEEIEWLEERINHALGIYYERFTIADHLRENPDWYLFHSARKKLRRVVDYLDRERTRR